MSAVTPDREPVLWVHFVAAALSAAAAFGLHLTADQTVALMGAVQALAAVLARSQVRPIKRR